MSTIRMLPLLVPLLGCAACFAPPRVQTTEEGSTGATEGETDPGDEQTSGGPGDPTGDTSQGSNTSGSVDTDSEDTDPGQTTDDPGCTPGVFGRSAFGEACFQ